MGKWWQNTVVYECYVKSFLDTDGSGIGDIKGISLKLNELKKLGVGAIWMTPVFKSPMVDNGYDVADYMDIDPSFGSMKDMENLLHTAKEKDMKIIMDLVFNHTSDQNRWFQESKKDKTNSKADWYIWRDAKEDGSAPTNWRGIFGGSAWTWCEERQQYYLHTFAVQQPDLNWANPEVRKAIIDVTNFWASKGVAGFRVDAITYIKKPEVFEDGQVDAEDGMSNIHAITANTKGILDYLHEYRDNVIPSDTFLVGEANGVGASELGDWVGSHGVFDLLFEFSHVDIQFQQGEIWYKPNLWTLKDLKHVLVQSQKNTEKEGWVPIFFENHDQPRSINHFFPKGKDFHHEATLLATVIYTMRGTPFLLQGEELGLENLPLDSIDDYNDISSKGQYDLAIKAGYSNTEAMAVVAEFSRDNARQPMPWNSTLNGGFSTGTSWLSVRKDYQTKNYEAEEKDPNSVLTYYRRLAEIRQEYPVLLDGSFTELLNDDENIFAYHRKNETDEAIILTNWSSEEQDIKIVIPSSMKYVISNTSHTEGKLQPYEAVVFAGSSKQ